MKTCLWVLFALFACDSSRAGLIGAGVSGVLTLGSDRTNNYFAQVSGFVPPIGYLNGGSGGTIVWVDPTAIEYGFADAGNLITADFTDGQLIVTDVTAENYSAPAFTMEFSSVGFRDVALFTVSDSFNSLTVDGFTLSSPSVDHGGTRTAVFNVVVVKFAPEPGSLALVWAGLTLICIVAIRRQSTA